MTSFTALHWLVSVLIFDCGGHCLDKICQGHRTVRLSDFLALKVVQKLKTEIMENNETHLFSHSGFSRHPPLVQNLLILEELFIVSGEVVDLDQTSVVVLQAGVRRPEELSADLDGSEVELLRLGVLLHVVVVERGEVANRESNLGKRSLSRQS